MYWSNTGDSEPDLQALLDHPWDPLPEDLDAASQELTHRAHIISGPHTKRAHGSWLCLRPIPAERILCPLSDYDYEQLQKDRKRDVELCLARWEETNRRLTALGFDPVKCDASGHTAPLLWEQITALLDRAEK